jgi:hypothetical protein
LGGDVGTEAYLAVVAAVIAVVTMGFTAHQSYLWRIDTRDRRAMEHLQLVRAFEADLAAVVDDLHEHLGGPDDGIDPAVRRAVVRLLVLAGQGYIAEREGVLRRASWEGMRGELQYWLSRDPARDAWRALRSQEACWPDGFVDFVDSLLAPLVPVEDAG